MKNTLSMKRGRCAPLMLSMIALAVGIYGGITMPAETGWAKMAMTAVLVAIGVFAIGNRLAYALVVAGIMIANGGYYS